MQLVFKMLENNNFPALDNLNSDIKRNLLKFNTIRIDLKNSGFNNDIEILEGSNISYKNYPDWLNDQKGKGLILQSFNGTMDLKIKCINKGSLRIAIRSILFLDKNSTKFPIYINIDKFYINDDLIITNKLVWHDEPYIIFRDVDDSEIIYIKIQWSPINNNSIFINSLKIKNDSLNNINQELNNEINILKRQLISIKNDKNKLQKDLNKYKDENFNLLISLEKISKENFNFKKELDELKDSKKRHSFFYKK